MSKVMEKLNANKILNNLVSKMYYNDLGQIAIDTIDDIEFSEESALVRLKDGRYFRIIIETSK